jgi:hypothetical protein
LARHVKCPSGKPGRSFTGSRYMNYRPQRTCAFTQRVPQYSRGSGSVKRQPIRPDHRVPFDARHGGRRKSPRWFGKKNAAAPIMHLNPSRHACYPAHGCFCAVTRADWWKEPRSLVPDSWRKNYFHSHRQIKELRSAQTLPGPGSRLVSSRCSCGGTWLKSTPAHVSGFSFNLRDRISWQIYHSTVCAIPEGCICKSRGAEHHEPRQRKKVRYLSWLGNLESYIGAQSSAMERRKGVVKLTNFSRPFSQ